MLDLQTLRTRFDQLHPDGPIFFDNAASTFVPREVITVVTEHLSQGAANVHRGTHALGEASTQQFESARSSIGQSFGASGEEVVFSGNASQAIALVALMLAGKRRRAILNRYDHHSTLLPWYQRYELSYLDSGISGRISPDAISAFGPLDDAVVALSHVSNVTGAIQPIEEIAQRVSEQRGLLLVDGSQSYPNMAIDVHALGCDFFVYSPHKAFGLPGVGILFIAARLHSWLEAPIHGGGTVEKASLDAGIVPRPIPHSLELGSPNTVGVIAAAAASKFLRDVRTALPEHCASLRAYLLDRLPRRFTVLGGEACTEGIGPITVATPGNSEIIATLLSQKYRIMMRGGYHCAHPLHRALATEGGLRISPYFYNTREECEVLVAALEVLSDI